MNETCYICGAIATTSDGIVGADLCDNTVCLDAAWDLAFAAPVAPVSSATEGGDGA